MTKKTQIIFDHQMVMMAKCMQAWNSCKVKATWLYCMFPVEALPYIILREHLSMKMFYQLIEKFFKIKYFSQLAVWVIIEFAFFFSSCNVSSNTKKTDWTHIFYTICIVKQLCEDDHSAAGFYR